MHNSIFRTILSSTAFKKELEGDAVAPMEMLRRGVTHAKKIFIFKNT
jgi:hypothetical protein